MPLQKNKKSNIPKNEYDSIHQWLKTQYGKANKCEHCKLNGKKKYEWALKKGFEYEKCVDNFIQLCTSCHLKYDYDDNRRRSVTEALKKRIRKSESYKKCGDKQRGIPKPNEVKEKISKTLTGKKSNNRKPVILYKENKAISFNSFTEASKQLNILVTSMANVVAGRSTHCRGYKVEYLYNK